MCKKYGNFYKLLLLFSTIFFRKNNYLKKYYLKNISPKFDENWPHKKKVANYYVS